MTTTDKYEALQIEAALHHEGSAGYLEERMGKILVARARMSEIHEQMSLLNREHEALQNEVWGWQCDINNVK